MIIKHHHVLAADPVVLILHNILVLVLVGTLVGLVWTSVSKTTRFCGFVLDRLSWVFRNLG